MSALTHPSSPWISRLAWLIAWVLALYLAWGAARLTWLFMVPSEKPVPVPQAARHANDGTRVDISALDLFGRASVVSQTSTAVVAPETRLQLSLLGVFTSQQPEDSGAIVSQRGQDSDYYRVGDTLPGQAELVEVHVDHVVLLRQGVREKLSFESGVSLAVATPAPASRTQFIDEARRRLQNEPLQALATVGLRPNADGAAGYVFDGSNPMLSGMNLQPGDVITSVNGTVLGNIEQDRQLLEQFAQAGMVEIEVERGGARFSVQVPLR